MDPAQSATHFIRERRLLFTRDLDLDVLSLWRIYEDSMDEVTDSLNSVQVN
jgi:hypothetical protein